MEHIVKARRVGPMAAIAFGAIVVAAPAVAQTITLVPHRAVYDLKLVEARGKASVQNARGRILYDFAGNSCEGYTLQFRQVSELDTGEGRTVLSDLRSTTWEEGASKTFRFNSQNFMNQQAQDGVDGRGERQSDGAPGAAQPLSRCARRRAAPSTNPLAHGQPLASLMSSELISPRMTKSL